jgi:hypothetical protein
VLRKSKLLILCYLSRLGATGADMSTVFELLQRSVASVVSLV